MNKLFVIAILAGTVMGIILLPSILLMPSLVYKFMSLQNAMTLLVIGIFSIMMSLMIMNLK